MIKNNEPYLYLDGLKEISKRLIGNEKIHIGIRPFGFHAGNKMALIAYPYLLAEQMKLNGIEPKFELFISINDFEPNELSYLEKKDDYYYYKKIADYLDTEEPTFGSNINCEKTNIGNLPDTFGCHKSIVDHYEEIIKRDIKETFENDFPKIKFNFVRNSKLLNKEIFKKYLKLSIQSPGEIASIIQKATGEKILTNLAKYAGAICPSCKSSLGDTKIFDSNVIFECVNCKRMFSRDITEFDYWIYHKPLLIPRLLTFEIDLCIRGGDHYQGGSVNVNSLLLKKFEPDFKEPLTLITPVVKDKNGNKLSKSYKNIMDISASKTIDLARKCKKDSVILDKS